mmetsp:Transcript_8921/g.23117  ORF Transcript_8921/g.23117 Transcript_8921/m.23117 type:complete len:221 (+) Transcript_8921:536-1198(+)
MPRCSPMVRNAVGRHTCVHVRPLTLVASIMMFLCFSCCSRHGFTSVKFTVLDGLGASTAGGGRAGAGGGAGGGAKVVSAGGGGKYIASGPLPTDRETAPSPGANTNAWTPSLLPSDTYSVYPCSPHQPCPKVRPRRMKSFLRSAGRQTCTHREPTTRTASVMIVGPSAAHGLPAPRLPISRMMSIASASPMGGGGGGEGARSVEHSRKSPHCVRQQLHMQ